MTLKPDFLYDSKGRKKSVQLSIREYNLLLSSLDELGELRAYDKVKREDDGKRYSLETIKKELAKRKKR